MSIFKSQHLHSSYKPVSKPPVSLRAVPRARLRFHRYPNADRIVKFLADGVKILTCLRRIAHCSVRQASWAVGRVVVFLVVRSVGQTVPEVVFADVAVDRHVEMID